MQLTKPWLAIGRAGVGKSTIGNVILTGNPDGNVFETSDSPDSCTTDVTTRTGTWGEFSMSFTDTPGLPDTDCHRTKDCYDKIINVMKKESFSVILLVFKYDKIDDDLFRKTEILFREINNTGAFKVLIINDHSNRSKRALPFENYFKFAQTVIQYTKINFFFNENCCLHEATMTSKIHALIMKLQLCMPQPSFGIRTFQELADAVNKAKTFVEYRAEVKARIVADINSREQELQNSAAISTIAGGMSAVIGVGSIVTAELLAIMPQLAVLLLGLALYAQKKKKDIRVAIKELKSEEDVADQLLKVAVEDLLQAEENFKRLCEALKTNADDYSK